MLTPPVSCSQARAHSVRLLRNFHAPSSPQRLLYITINSKLPRGKRTHHKQSRTNTGITTLEAELLRDLDQAGSGALSREALGLVDLREHGVRGLGDDRGGETGDQAGAEVDCCLQTVGGGGLVEVLPGELGDFLVDDEFGHCVGDSGGLLGF